MQGKSAVELKAQAQKSTASDVKRLSMFTHVDHMSVLRRRNSQGMLVLAVHLVAS